MKTQRPMIIDSTLREGNQAPGMAFTVEQTAVVARLLDRVGVDMIECGHAAASEHERARIRTVAALNLDIPLLGHARACPEDIDLTADAGADWVGIFAGINAISRHSRLSGRSRGDVIAMVVRAVERAKERGLKVRYTVEDASRTDDGAVLEAFERVVQVGVDRLCFADTTGVLTPNQVRGRLGRLREIWPDAAIESHFHDDRGMAIANSLAALEAGATWLSTSVNGLGERCGITDLACLIGNLLSDGLRDDFDLEALQELSKYVGAISRSPPDARRPVVGRNAFTHTSKLHALAMTRDVRSYSWFDPAKLGRRVGFADKPAPAVDDLIVTPQAICATELKHHRAGPGVRYVFIDERFVKGAEQYCIVRRVPVQASRPEGHVDGHRHAVDSLWMFLGGNEDLTGLCVEVLLEGERRRLESPAAVHIPAGMLHSYSVVSGSGHYINHVQAGLYNESLLETEDYLERPQTVVDEGGPAVPSFPEFRKVIAEFIADKLHLDAAEVGDDENFLGSGDIDSVGMIELFFLIEDTWGRDLMPLGFDPERVGSIAGLHRQLRYAEVPVDLVA